MSESFDDYIKEDKEKSKPKKSFWSKVKGTYDEYKGNYDRNRQEEMKAKIEAEKRYLEKAKQRSELDKLREQRRKLASQRSENGIFNTIGRNFNTTISGYKQMQGNEPTQTQGNRVIVQQKGKKTTVVVKQPQYGYNAPGFGLNPNAIQRSNGIFMDSNSMVGSMKGTTMGGSSIMQNMARNNERIVGYTPKKKKPNNGVSWQMPNF
jgi:hypothetical protein